MADEKLPSVSMGRFAILGAVVEVRRDPFRDGDDMLEISVQLKVSHLTDPDDAGNARMLRSFHGPAWRRMSEAHRHAAIRDLVRALVLHEVDEWLRIDGELVTDPHPELREARRGA